MVGQQRTGGDGWCDSGGHRQGWGGARLDPARRDV
jgi:hypothetical protein